MDDKDVRFVRKLSLIIMILSFIYIGVLSMPARYIEVSRLLAIGSVISSSVIYFSIVLILPLSIKGSDNHSDDHCEYESEDEYDDKE